MKTLNLKIPAALACLWLMLAHGAGGDVGSFQATSVPSKVDWANNTGQKQTITLPERNPMGSTDGMKQRGNQMDTSYDISKINYEVYIPKSYDGTTAFGLVVFMDVEDTARIDNFMKAAETHHYILIGPDRGDGDMRYPIREAQALDAVYNLKKMFKIDDERVYAAGTSDGGFVACYLTQQFPDVFAGGIYDGSAIYIDYIMPQRGVFYAGFMMPAQIIDLSRHHARHVFYTGRGQFTHDGMFRVYNGMKKGGIDAVTMLDDPDLKPREMIREDFIDKAISALDAPMLAGAKKIYDEAVAAEQRQQLGVALSKYRKSLALGFGEEWAKEANDRVTDLSARADAILADATASFDNKDYAKARSTLADLNRQFATAIPAGAKALAAKLDADPNAKKTLVSGEQQGDSSLRESAALTALNAAHDTLAKDPVAGYEALQSVASTYTGTKAGVDANTEAKAIWADPAKRKQIEPLMGSKEAASMLNLAKQYLDNDQADLGKTKLKAIVEKFPQTPAGIEAKQMLDKLN